MFLTDGPSWWLTSSRRIRLLSWSLKRILTREKNQVQVDARIYIPRLLHSECNIALIIHLRYLICMIFLYLARFTCRALYLYVYCYSTDGRKASGCYKGVQAWLDWRPDECEIKMQKQPLLFIKELPRGLVRLPDRLTDVAELYLSTLLVQLFPIYLSCLYQSHWPRVK